MSKIDIIKKIEAVGVVAVVRANNTEQGVKISKACIDGGISAIEVTFTVPKAEQVIQTLADTFDAEQLCVGAGTVLDAETARIAILHGAKFIVSPIFDLETARLCQTYQVPYMPGCMTITEIVTAMRAGADIIKVFPGGVYGPSFIKSVKGPLPQAVLMPTGGVNLDNVEEWIKNGCIAVGVGSALTKPAQTGDFKQITVLAKQYVEKVQLARL